MILPKEFNVRYERGADIVISHRENSILRHIKPSDLPDPDRIYQFLNHMGAKELKTNIL